MLQPQKASIYAGFWPSETIEWAGGLQRFTEGSGVVRRSEAESRVACLIHLGDASTAMHVYYLSHQVCKERTWLEMRCYS